MTNVAGIDYFDNLNKYKSEATASMDTYRNHAVEKVKESNKAISDKIDQVQKAGLGLSSLGMAVKSINKQIPKEWLEFQDETQGYNFGDSHLHSKQMTKGGGDGLDYEVPSENFNNIRQPRPGDRMRSAIEPETSEGIYERLTEPTSVDTNVSSTPAQGIEEETNVDVQRLTEIENQSQEDLDAERIQKLTAVESAGDVEPNIVEGQQTYSARGGSEAGAGASSEVMTAEEASRFTQDPIPTLQSIEESKNIQRLNAIADAEDEIKPAPQQDKPKPIYQDTIDSEIDKDNTGGSALDQEAQEQRDEITEETTQETQSTSVEPKAEEAGEGFEEITSDALLGAEEGTAGEEAVAVGLDAVGMASGVGEAVGATLLLGSLAYELSQSSKMKSAEKEAQEETPTQVASYGGANIQETGSSSRGIV